MLALELQMQVALFIHIKMHLIAKEYLDLIRDYYENLYKLTLKSRQIGRACLKLGPLMGSYRNP